MLFDNLGGLGLVHCHKPLIIAHVGFHGRLIADQYADEIHAADVLAEHDNTDRKRSCENEAYRTPKPGPECDCDEKSDPGNPRVSK